MSKAPSYFNPDRLQSSLIIRLLVCITLVLAQRLVFSQYSDSSVLSNGEIFKITTNQNGIYKISYSFLKDQLGLDIDNINPQNIHIYGNGGGLLPEDINTIRIDDLYQNHIEIIGEADGTFDPNDYILFYGQSADKKTWNASQNRFEMPKNIYTDEVTYFLKIADNPGLRISKAPEFNFPTYSSSQCDSHYRLEKELVNLLDDFNGASGTGQSWYGDLFKGITDRSYTIEAPNVIPEADSHFKIEFAARSGTTSRLNVDIEDQTFSGLIGSVNLSDSEGRYARIGNVEGNFIIRDNVINIDINYPHNGSNSGWLDYIEVNTVSLLNEKRAKSPFSDHQSLNHVVSTFQIHGARPTTQVWDLTSPLEPQKVLTTEITGGIEFNYNSELLRTFVAYDDLSFLTPTPVGQVDNQNLHGLGAMDMIVLYPSEMVDAAELFTSHRSMNSGLQVEMIDIEQVYNEFGSGAPSPVAIRDFVKMLFDRNTDFKYLLLLGDASFDFKNLKKLSNPSNLIPTYETKESLDPIRGFPSDDFYALLSPGEGSNLKGALDISVGRLPAKTNDEAMDMVNKIVSYDTNPDRLGDWMNKITFVADDEDFNIHLNQADQIAQKLNLESPIFNIEKIYLDAFKQVSTAGGELYPEVQEAINNSLFKGTKVINYMGHGGSTGFAQERVLTINDVGNWNNANKLALLVTATCSFTGYDDPNFVTAGERAILNPNGGAIALFTTVRAVYSSSNERLTKAVFDNLFKPKNGVIPPIGDILRIAKNSNAADTLGINARKFLLIGDPSLSLATPQFNIKTTEINGELTSSGIKDTLKALTPITITGQIDHNNTILSNFNGSVDIEIYDKPKSVSTLGQDPTSFVRNFDIQKNIVFKGSSTVTEGVFSFSFIVPKDIDYQFGEGKISYYAKSSDNRDATGYYSDLIIGGTSENSFQDDQGPEIEIFMDDENFISGGITSSNPTLIVHLKDDYGINIVGNSIGHDITAVLDNETSNTFVLNEFYKSELDNNKEGTVRFPLKDIDVGLHSIEIKAWDIANNSTISSIDFVVAQDSKSAIKQILIYPNPVTDQALFRIDHDISSGPLDITIDIFAIDGKLVQSLKYNRGTSGGIIDNLAWNGTDTLGMPMKSGIYLYKVTIKDSANSSKETNTSNLEKMVIIK